MNWVSLLTAVALAATLSLGAFAQTGGPSTNQELETLEKRFFIHDFSKEPIEQRLERMEKFTFGESGKGATQARLARIAATLETHSPDTPISSISAPKAGGAKPIVAAKAPNATFPANAPPAAQPADDSDDGSTDYPHITFLENEILNQSFAGQPLSTRLSRLESKAFGSPSKNPDMSDRTDALERYAEVKLHKRAFAPSPSESDDDEQVASQPAPVKREDPEAALPDPPAEGARMLTRIAWCEMHTFGRTYPEQHLLARLHQLNAKIFPLDHEKDIQLMDHVDAIVKEVVLRQHPPSVASR